MKINFNDPMFIDKFLVSNEVISKKKVFWGWFILISCVILYISAVILQIVFTGNSTYNGIVAQFQILFSVSMVVGTVKPSYVIAFSLNALNACLVTSNYIRTGDSSVIAGIIVPCLTILILATIRMFDKGVHAKMKKIVG